MSVRFAATLAVLGAIAGCISYSGGARSLDPARLTTEPGWIVAPPTPQLHQAGSYDCGAASLAMIAGRWHVPLSVDQVAAALPAATPRGARLGDLRDVARAHGLTAFAIAGDRATLVHELQAGRPVIVGLLLPYDQTRAQSHYEVIVAVHPEDDRFATIDPALGWRSRSWADLDAEWRPVGRPTLVVLGPAGAAAPNREATAKAAPCRNATHECGEHRAVPRDRATRSERARSFGHTVTRALVAGPVGTRHPATRFAFRPVRDENPPASVSSLVARNLLWMTAQRPGHPTSPHHVPGIRRR